MLDLNLEAFRAWLTMNARRIFHVGSCRTCPLASYLLERDPALRADDVYVDGRCVRVRGRMMETPAWAVEFIRRVDECRRGKVSGLRALRALHVAERTVS